MEEIRIFRLGLYNSVDYSDTVCYVSDEHKNSSVLRQFCNCEFSSLFPNMCTEMVNCQETAAEMLRMVPSPSSSVLKM